MRAWTRSALLHCLSLFLFVLGLNLATTASAALPGPLGAADQSQRRKTGRQRATEAIARPGHPDAGNDKTRTELLNRLKQLRDATKQDTQTAQGGILAFIREAAESLEKQLDGPNSPVARWSTLYRQARTEITTARRREWPSLIRTS